MAYLPEILSNSTALKALLFPCAGICLSLLKFPENPVHRQYVFWVLWAIGGVILLFWLLDQNSLVVIGSLNPSPDLVPVDTKGGVRYVPAELANRYRASLWTNILYCLCVPILKKFNRFESQA